MSIHRRVFMATLPCKKLTERARQRCGEGHRLAGGRMDEALHDGDVEALDAVLRELLLQALAGVEVLGKEEHAGGLAIEAMDDVNAVLAPLRAEVLVEVRLHGRLALARRRHGEQPVRL